MFVLPLRGSSQSRPAQVVLTQRLAAKIVVVSAIRNVLLVTFASDTSAFQPIAKSMTIAPTG